MTKNQFKREELQHELRHEDAMLRYSKWAVAIDGKVWKVTTMNHASAITRTLRLKGKNVTCYQVAWKKSEKVLDRKEFLPYLNNMTNDFANISAESNLSDMIALRIEDFTGPIPESWGGEPMELTEAEKAEANAWFDERRDSWMMDLVGTI